MTLAVNPGLFAWQPLTPRGVAAFAKATAGRLWLVQGIIALLAASVVVWFFATAWFPIVRAAIRALPVQGEIRGGQLIWPGASPVRLAAGHDLALLVDMQNGARALRTAQVEIGFGESETKACSLFGCLAIGYPAGWIIAFNRTELEPWWGAWEPAILAGIGAGVWLGLMLSWTALATVYWIPVRLIAFYRNRDLNLRGSWLLAGAALMPGAVFLTLGIIGYGLAFIDLLRLLVIAGIHVLIGWIYLVVGPGFLPLIAEAAPLSGNPFAAPAAQKAGDPAETNPGSKKPSRMD